LKLFEAVCARLDAASVPYALIGATALGIHGVARSTLDLDLLAMDSRVLDPAFWGDLARYAGVRRGDADDPLLGAVRFLSSDAYPVDLVVGRFPWQSGILDRAERLPVGERRVPVCGAADLILLKLFAGGAQDRWDIQQLLAVRPDAAAEVEMRLPELQPESGRFWSELRR
jgi:predicted nucleotidyltransferase